MADKGCSKESVASSPTPNLHKSSKMRKICSDGHNTHDASRRTMAGGGIDFAAHFYTNSPNTTNRFIVFIMFLTILRASKM